MGTAETVIFGREPKKSKNTIKRFILMIVGVLILTSLLEALLNTPLLTSDTAHYTIVNTLRSVSILLAFIVPGYFLIKSILKAKDQQGLAISWSLSIIATLAFFLPLCILGLTPGKHQAGRATTCVDLGTLFTVGALGMILGTLSYMIGRGADSLLR